MALPLSRISFAPAGPIGRHIHPDHPGGRAGHEGPAIAQYPDLVPPTVNVSVSYPGASAETIAATVLAPLEVNINGVENMLYMTSTAASGSGSGSINVYFSLGTNPDMALVNVNNKVQPGPDPFARRGAPPGRDRGQAFPGHVAGLRLLFARRPLR